MPVLKSKTMVRMKKRSLVRPLKKVKKTGKSADQPAANDEIPDVADENVIEPKCTDETPETSEAPVVSKQKKVKLRRGPVLLKGEPSPLHPLASVTKSLLDAEDGSKKKGRNTKILSLRDLAASIEKSSADAVKPVVKELTKLAKKKSLNVPLLKPEADRVSRAANYEDVSNTTTKKWGDIVRIHQTADHLSFPLPVVRSLDDDAPAPVPKMNLKSEMEQKIEALLSSSENRLEDHKVLTPAEEKLMKTLSVEDAKERLKELQRTRALLSYQEVKMKRQSKIKSKSFHRIRKRGNLRDALKDFESLKETDPAAALKQLQDFDKTRALERASLRHRNTGRFAKQAKIRAKYDDTARAALEEQMHIHQQSTKRREHSSDEEQEAGDDGEEDGDAGLQPVHSDDDDQQMDGNKEVAKSRDPSDDPIADGDEGDFDVADSYNPWLKRTTTTNDSLQNEAEKEGVVGKSGTHAPDREVPQIRLRKSFLKNPADDVIDADAADGDDGDEQAENGLVLRKRNQMEVISEAFAEDDVVQEFVKETQEKEKLNDEEEKELPGWGSWTGQSLLSIVTFDQMANTFFFLLLVTQV